MANQALQSFLDELNRSLDDLQVQTLTPQAAEALRNAKQQAASLAEELRKNENQSRLAALYRVSQALGSSLDLDEVLNQVMDSVISLTGAERGFLVLLEPGSSEWGLRAARNFSQETLLPKDMQVSRTVINTVITSQHGLVTTDAQTDPRFSQQESVIIYSLRSILCAPLLTRGKTIGAIYVDNRAVSGLFTPDDLEMLNTFASQASIAIENARLYTQTDLALTQRVGELETLARVDSELNAELDLGHVLDITCKWVCSISQASSAWVWLMPGGASGEERPVVYPADDLLEQDMFIRRVMRRAAPESEAVPNTGYRLGVPLLRGGAPIGVIIAQREQPFSIADCNFLGYLAGRATSAIQNARLYGEVQQANQAKSKFVSVVTHELRIPMTSIKGYADLMKAGVVGPLNEQQINFINVIRNNVERMSALVSDLADISRIETGRLRLECKPVMVGSHIEEVLRTLGPRLQEKNQTLTSEIPAGLPAVFADPNRVVQILNNLLSNAWKYTPAGGAILVKAEALADSVRLSVKDNGIGISAEDQVNLFTQFFRSENQAVRDEQGWGLGLSVARRLVEVMGGEMGYESAVGQGSTFWFTLPIGEGRCRSD